MWVLAALLGGFGMTDDDPLTRGLACVAVGLVGLGYGISRGLAKKGEA